MVRLPVHGLLTVLAVLCAGLVPVTLVARVDKDYVELEQLGRRYGMSPVWTVPGQKLRLQSEWTKLEFTAGSREIGWNGIRVFLGESVEADRGALYLSPEDLATTLVPLLKPAAVFPPPGELKVIAIDAGHGGSDPGTENRSLKLQEKKLTLDVAQRLGKILEQRGYRVVMTRTTDTRLARTQLADLQARAAAANQAGADLFISIHFNALPSDAKVSGIETYALSPAGLRSTAAHLYSKTNDTVQPGNRYDHWNMVLCAALHPQLLQGLQAVDRGMKRARFAVLKTIKCPAVLVEAGFLSSRTEAAKISTAGHRQKIAEAIADGITDYAGRLREARSAAG